MKNFISGHLEDIILAIGVILISLFSFALGFIVAKSQEKEPLKIEMNANYSDLFTSHYEKTESRNNRSRDFRFISRLETLPERS